MTLDPQAQKILDLIEAVDPEDTRTLDEISARLACWLEREEFSPHTDYNVGCEEPFGRGIPRYHKSLDAIKAIQPEGYDICTHGDWPSFCIKTSSPSSKMFIGGPSGKAFWKVIMTRKTAEGAADEFSVRGLPTEELARLHVTIQAISHERGQK